MKTSIKTLTAGILAGMAFVALCGTARADLTVSNSTTITSWNSVSGQNPFYVSIPSASLTGFTSQGQPTADSGATYTVLSETFTITNGAGSLANGNTNYTLTGVAIVAGNQPPNSFIHLFDVTATLTSNNGTPLQGSGATYNFVTNGDLLGAGNGLALSNTLAGTDQVLYNLSTGPNSQDQVVLGAGHTYTFEIWTPAGGFSWSRNSVADAGGQGMGSHNANLGVARLTISSLGLAGGAPRTFTLALYGSPTSAAPSVNNNTNAAPLVNYYIDQFNSFGYGPTNTYVGTNNYSIGQITNIWGNWFGSAWISNGWDATSDAQNNINSGSLKITANFPNGDQYLAFDSYGGINPPLNGLALGLTSFECDVRFDPNSATKSPSGTPIFGHLRFGTRTPTYSQDYFGGVDVPASNTNWVHVSIPINSTTDANLTNISDVLISLDSGYYSGALNGPSILWVDNLKFVGPVTVVVPPPPAPPTLTIQKATPALRIFAGSSANTYDRAELATIDQSQSWIGGAYPVSYSFTLLSYPANINQTHIFLIPVNSSGQANMGNISGSVNEYIDYQASNGMWLVLGPSAGGVTATVEWKTNLPNANPDHTALFFTNSTAIGTWTLTFTGNNVGTVTGPGGSPMSFTITNGTVATDFANPVVAYFGLQPNSGAGMGQYEDWASISVAGVAGVNENDSFTTDASFNSALWNINTLTVALNTCVQLVATNTPYWVNWTLPAVGYGLGTAMDVLGNTNTSSPWMLPEYYNGYGDGNTIPGSANQGSKTWILIPSTCLPTVDGSQGGTHSPNAFFKLFNPPLSN
jgi:hypothetical protein